MKHEWAKMTWREVREAASGPKPVVLVPVGCVEPQGPHTPTGMEFLMAESLSREVARQTQSVALPAIPFGNSNDFVNIPGTIYIQPDTLARYYEDVYRSILRAGFSHVLFVAYHIPNQWVLETVARKIREEMGVLCAWINPGALAATYLKDLFPDPGAARGHGAEPGMSLMRFLVPDAVDLSDAKTTPAASTFRGFKFMGGGPVVGNVSIGMPVNWDDLYPVSGGYGNPTLGSGEIGRQMFDRLVKDLSAVVVSFRAMDVRVKTPARV
jgi:creatinine amidohydrolase